MRHRRLVAALAGLGFAALLSGSANAGVFDPSCNCGYGYPAARVTYAPPTYTYAPATVTVYPRYVIQPHYVVERTTVVRENHYVREPVRYVDEAAPCLVCGIGRLFAPAPVEVAPTQMSYGPRYVGRYHRYAVWNSRWRHHRHHHRAWR